MEGIIDKVFAKYERWEGLSNYEFKKMKKELKAEIEKIPIKDYFEHYQPNHYSCNSNCNLDIIRTLIGNGDSK